LARYISEFAAVVLFIYAARHYGFTLYRALSQSKYRPSELSGCVLPSITVIVPMHNEERVGEHVLEALARSNYPTSRLRIIAVNDRSTDRTGQIINACAGRYEFIEPVHRCQGKAGKAAVLQEASKLTTDDIILVFDADYIPSPNLVALLATAFVDPEVGAVMGRVVPHNIGDSILAATLSKERAAGYQIHQECRRRAGLVPQYGGTVGGVRREALEECGGWNDGSLTEDTDLTCRLALRGWQVEYINAAECYEEVPVTWVVRRRQLIRWVQGHTECLYRYGFEIAKSRRLTNVRKIDLLLHLSCYLTAPVMLAGWLASLILLCSPTEVFGTTLLALITLMGFQTFGNQACFFEIAVADVLDGSRRRLLLLPFQVLAVIANTSATCTALFHLTVRLARNDSSLIWHKTARTREADFNRLLQTADAASFGVSDIDHQTEGAL
jgi:cellulose synthase/poly-beta-1,6-N-acetylglucosamine synthase-like glycosyltransferase